MILEVIIQSFLSGVGSTLLKEWMSQAKKKDEARLRELIRQELKGLVGPSSVYANEHPPSSKLLINILPTE